MITKFGGQIQLESFGIDWKYFILILLELENVFQLSFRARALKTKHRDLIA
jgi:hypothetical protein